MTKDEFLNKYKLSKWFDKSQLNSFLSVLDFCYCAYTKDQVVQMVKDFYDNADNIYNEDLLITTPKNIDKA